MKKVFLALALCCRALAADGTKASLDFESIRAELRSFVSQYREALEKEVPSLLKRDCCGQKGDPINVRKDGSRVVGAWLVLAQENHLIADYTYREWGDGEKGRWEHEESVYVIFELRAEGVMIKDWQIGRPKKKASNQTSQPMPLTRHG